MFKQIILYFSKWSVSVSGPLCGGMARLFELDLEGAYSVAVLCAEWQRSRVSARSTVPYQLPRRHCVYLVVRSTASYRIIWYGIVSYQPIAIVIHAPASFSIHQYLNNTLEMRYPAPSHLIPFTHLSCCVAPCLPFPNLP